MFFGYLTLQLLGFSLILDVSYKRAECYTRRHGSRSSYILGFQDCKKVKFQVLGSLGVNKNNIFSIFRSVCAILILVLGKMCRLMFNSTLYLKISSQNTLFRFEQFLLLFLKTFKQISNFCCCLYKSTLHYNKNLMFIFLHLSSLYLEHVVLYQ